jgi:ATP-dependent Zn protease
LLRAVQLLDAAEAKAYWGLAKNYSALEALVAALMERETLSGAELADILQEVRTIPGMQHQF